MKRTVKWLDKRIEGLMARRRRLRGWQRGLSGLRDRMGTSPADPGEKQMSLLFLEGIVSQETIGGIENGNV